MPFPTISPQGGRVTVAVSYVTSPESSAIQWLPPAQTAGKNYPYLFTQCQAIHARSMVPCIDAPGHKVCEGGGGQNLSSPLFHTCSSLTHSSFCNRWRTSSDPYP